MPSPRFFLQDDSIFLKRSSVQEGMMRAIEETDKTEKKNVIIVSPCGSGKSAVIIESLLAAGTLVLVLCYESQGVYQMAEAVRKNTNVRDHQLYVYCGKSRDLPPISAKNPKFCFLITTYGMVADTKAHRNKESVQVRNFVRNTKWNLVCCDEFHHAGAETYKPLVEGLAKTADRVLGFTATLYRSDNMGAENFSIENEERAFSEWFGPVAYRATCQQLEEAGLIAKIRRLSIHCNLTPEFAGALVDAKGSQHQYIAALNPTKLNALKTICDIHWEDGHRGIVFVTHLLVAKVVKACLGEGWAVLSGGAAHGDDEKHSAEDNDEIVKAFNAGKHKGMICTKVGESSMDVNVDSFCYVCVFDADSGIASAGQRMGRVARSDRNLEEQKQACYYDFVTLDTSDESAAKVRQKLFDIEGYAQNKEISDCEVMKWAKVNEIALPYTSLVAEVQLLKQVLLYSKLDGEAKRANQEATERTEEARQQLKTLKDKSKEAKTKVMREMAKSKLPKAQTHLKERTTVSKSIKHDQLKHQRMDGPTKTIFRKLRIPLRVLAAAGLYADVELSSDDE